jgi:hypothetical protein
MKNIECLLVKSSIPPTIEIDGASRSAYIRFSNSKIAKTISEDKPGPVITIDLDAQNNTVGVELIGVAEFSIQCLTKLLPPIKRQIDWERARFVPTGAPESVVA